MAGHRFGGTDRNLVRVVAKNFFDRLGFTDIAKTGRSGVGVDVVDVVRRNLRVIERQLHGPRGASAVFRRRGHVVGVGGKSITGELTIDLRAALLRVFELFDNGNARAFADDETVAVPIERARRALRFVVALAERFHRGKTGETKFDDRSFGTAGDKNIGVAKFNHPPRFADGVIGSRASGDDAHVGAAQTELHRDNAAGHVADEHWNGEGGDALRPLVHQRAELVFQRFQPADAAADNHAEAVPIHLLQVEAAVLDRHLRSGHGQLNETIRAPDVFGVVEKVFWIEVAHFTADFAIVVRGVEGLNPADAAFAFNQIFPKGLETISDGSDNTEAGNYNAPIVIHKESDGESLFLARAHADALHGLEKFPFGFDRGRDDDFGLLKLGNVAGANVAHASRDRADEVLAAVINLGRPEKDLFQRTGGADLDPRPAREIHMRGRHSPMITRARRLLRASKRAADHDCIRATRERFANVAALAHSAVSNDWDITRSFFEISVAGGGAIDRGGDLRHAQAKHATRSASCSGTDTDENASRTAFHNFQRDIVADGVADDDRDAHVGAKFCQIKRFVFGRDVSRG